MSDEAVGSGWWRAHAVTARLSGVILVLSSTLLWLVIAALHRALGASRNDDWTYYRIAFEMAQSRQFAPDPYTKTMLIGQVLGALPIIWAVGNSIVALQIATALLGAVGLISAYSLLRQFLPASWSALGVGTLAFGPLYGSLAVSFMSDVPAFALQAVSLRIGYEALRKPRLHYGWLVASLAVGLAGFSVREYAVAAPLSILAVALLGGSGRRTRLAVLGAGVAFVSVAATLYLWRAGLTDAGGAGLVATVGRQDASVSAKMVFTIAMLLLPIIVIVSPTLLRWDWPPWTRFALTIGASGLATLWWVMPTRRLGNYVQPIGSYPETLRGQPPALFSEAFWATLDVLVLVATVILAAVLIQLLRPAVFTRWRTAPRAFTLSVVYLVAVAAVLLVVSIVTKNWMFDRYLVPLIPYGSGALLHVSSVASAKLAAGQRILFGVIAVAYLLFSFRIVDASSTFDGAKWRLAKSMQATGVSAQTIDGGLEWFGMHQPEPVLSRRPVPHGSNFWLGLFARPEVCFVSTFTQASGPFTGPSVKTLTATSLTGVTYRLEVRPVDLGCPSTAQR